MATEGHPMVTAHLSIGSNLGDRLDNLARGARALTAAGDLQLAAVSSVYETAPWGKAGQPAFLNACLAVRTALGPRALLERCQAAEQALGRVRLERWGPRTLDVDVALYGNALVREPDLTVPHPRLGERAFVLVPLLELDPGLVLPDGLPLAGLLGAVQDQPVEVVLPAAAFLAKIGGLQ